MRIIGLILLVAAALTVPAALLGHHSVPVNFDQSREITVAGILTEVTGPPGRRERVVLLSRAFVHDGGELRCVGSNCESAGGAD